MAELRERWDANTVADGVEPATACSDPTEWMLTEELSRLPDNSCQLSDGVWHPPIDGSPSRRSPDDGGVGPGIPFAASSDDRICSALPLRNERASEALRSQRRIQLFLWQRP